LVLNVTEATTQAKPPESPKKKSPAIAVLFSLVLILLVVAAGFGGYLLWTKQQSYEATVSALKKDLNQSDESIRQLKQASSALSAQQERVTQVLSETSSQTQARISALTQQLDAIKGSSRKDWLLAEAEYLLRIANQRLLIESDPQASESLLAAADKVLNEIGDPGLMPVRMAIAEEIYSLQGSALNQVESLYSKLSALSNAAYSLELSYQGRTPNNDSTSAGSRTEVATNTSNEQSEKGPIARFLHKLVHAFSNAVRIQRKEQVIEAPPTPDFAEYLKQNLALQLEQIKLSLIKQHGARYVQELEETIAWAKQNLPSDNAQAQQIIDQLEKLSRQTLNWQKPDISHSLMLLQARIEEMYRRHTLSKHAADDALDTPLGSSSGSSSDNSSSAGSSSSSLSPSGSSPVIAPEESAQ
jgi:uroporphyrin-III C-methyltransferase